VTIAPMSIDRVLGHPELLALDLSTRSTWLAVLKAAFALPLNDAERETFTSVAGARTPPTKRVRELWVNAGRRSDKSEMAGALSVYFALFVQHKLSRGERGMVLTLAATTEQARVVYNYALALLQSSRVLAREIDSVTRQEIRLKNGITIAMHANSFRSIRGRTLCACIFDEVAWWRDESTATPDKEVYSAVLPALLTTHGMLVAISSPYRRTGLLYAKHKQFYGVDSDDTLVVSGPTLIFNPTVDEAAIAAQQEADPTAARSEWLAEFRTDISGFLDEELIDRAVDHGRPLELPPRADVFYRAFVDTSGGTAGGDAYTICIAHKQRDGRLIIDVVRGRAGPFDPVQVTREFVDLCKQYRVRSVVGDAYAAEWSASAWKREGIAYIPSPLNASQLYIEALPAFTRGLVSLPDHPKLLRELRLLERSPTRMGKEQVTHSRGCHDDYANVVCAVLHNLSSGVGYDLETLRRAFAL
jgi:hypothetical protein